MPKFGGVFNVEQVQSLVKLGLFWNCLMLEGFVVHEAGLRGHPCIAMGGEGGGAG